MKLSISNIAWPLEFDEEALRSLPDAGFTGIEIAPTKLWPAPTDVSSRTLRDYRKKVQDLGLSVVALQSLLFGRPDLQIFREEEARRSTADYMKRLIGVASDFGAETLVFGSPRNRLRGDLSKEAADEIASDFFRTVGDEAHASGVRIGIEANPAAYQADYLTNSDEAIDFVRRLDHPGVRLHLCAGCMSLAGDDPMKAVERGYDLLVHAHISEPMLAPVSDAVSLHSRFATALRNFGYSGWTSIEMKTSEPFSLDFLVQNLNFARDLYGPVWSKPSVDPRP